MDFALSEEHNMIMETTKAFVEKEMKPHEDEIERTGVIDPELVPVLRKKAH